MSNGYYHLKFVNNPVPFKSNRQIEICLLIKNNCLLRSAPKVRPLTEYCANLIEKDYKSRIFALLWVLYQASMVPVNLILWEGEYFSAPDIPSYHIEIPGRLKTKLFLFFFLKLAHSNPSQWR